MNELPDLLRQKLRLIADDASLLDEQSFVARSEAVDRLGFEIVEGEMRDFRRDAAATGARLARLDRALFAIARARRPGTAGRRSIGRVRDCSRSGDRMSHTAKLLFFCGKMAAGKSTLSRELAERENAVLLVEDELLERLYPGEIVTIADYAKYSSRIKNALAPHVRALLSRGISVVLDFPGNTRRHRAWFRELFESAGADHELHFVDASDELCKRQLRERSKNQPAGTAWTTDAEFDAITAYFEPPSAEERFRVIRHARV